MVNVGARGINVNELINFTILYKFQLLNEMNFFYGIRIIGMRSNLLNIKTINSMDKFILEAILVLIISIYRQLVKLNKKISKHVGGWRVT